MSAAARRSTAALRRAELKATWAAMRATAASAPGLSGRLAAHLWFTPWPLALSDGARGREQQWLAGTHAFSLRSGRSLLRGFEAGEGPAVLLVHGWGDRAASLGAFIAPLVERGYRVVGVDMPAHGASTGRTANLYQWADAISALAEHVGGAEAVVAHSLGGATTTLALTRGAPVRAVALLAPAVRLRHAVDRFADRTRLPSATVPRLAARIEARFGPSVWADTCADLVAPSITAPALIVHDRDDREIAFADGDRLAAAWPGARLHATRGLGHLRLLRDPAVIGEVTAFLASPAAVIRPADPSGAYARA